MGGDKKGKCAGRFKKRKTGGPGLALLKALEGLIPMGRIMPNFSPHVVRIKCYGPVNDPTCPVDGAYLKAWDIEADGGHGRAEFCYDVEQAYCFYSMADAMAAWYQQSWTTPTRPDGKPNRPLTSFTSEFVWEPLKKEDA